MADGQQRQSVFLAPTFSPSEAEGPFTQMLMEPLQGRPATPVVPGGGISPYAAAAAIAEKFFEGASQGRIRKFALEENSKTQKLNALNSYFNAVMSNPDITEEGKTAAWQRYAQAIGATGQEALAGGKGKGKGKGKQPEGPLGHIGNALGSVFQALSGGQMPEGAADVGSTMADIQGMLFAQGKLKPEYSRRSAMEQIFSQAVAAGKEAGLKPGETPAEKALAVYAPHFQKAQAIDPVGAQAMAQNLLGSYQPAPAPSRAGEDVKARVGAAMDLLKQQYPGGVPDHVARQVILSNVGAAKTVDLEADLQEYQDAAKKFKFEAKPEDLRSLAMSRLGFKPSGSMTFGPVTSGKDLTFDVDTQGNPRDPSKFYRPVKVGTEITGWMPSEPTRFEARAGKPIMGSSLPVGTKDVFGRPIVAGQLYSPMLDSMGNPRSYMPTAMQNEYRTYFNPETGEMYAMPVPRYQMGPQILGGETPGAPPPGVTPTRQPVTTARPKIDRAADVEKTSGVKLSADQRVQVNANPFAAPRPKEETPKSGAPRGGISLGARPQKMSQMATRSLEQVDSALVMANRLKSLLQQTDKEGKALYTHNAVWDKMRRMYDWGKYRLGFASELDNVLASKQAFVALNEILSGLPYMQSMRNMTYLRQIQQHIPDPTDTPALMWEKVNIILDTLPQLRKIITDAEKTRYSRGTLVGPAAEIPPSGEQAPRTPRNPF